jgi:hypothetical protein
MEERLRSLFKTGRIYQREILESPREGEASKFYFVCRNGDINTVREILPTIPYDQLNQLEPNGSTPLHAATYFGHLEIVRLLIHEYGCQRHLRNRYGFTAYEEAQTDEMRQLYHRPSNENRFNDDSNDTKQTFQIVSALINENEKDEMDDDNDVTKPDHRYLIGYETNEEIKKQLDGLNGVKALFQSRVGRYIMEQGMKLKLAKDAGYNEEEYAYVTSEKFRQEALRKILDEHVTSNHYDYKHCCHLLKEYIEQGTIESLLRLYTLETPFYRQLLILSSPLGFPFFMHLSDLKQRYYQGHSYRGVRLTRHELNEYCWALRRNDSVLSLLTFSSTSIVRDVAERFSANYSPSSNEISTLLIFYFPQPCDTAINLSEIPEYQLPCISNYENEKEVLIGPRTFFKVTEIETDRSNERCTIYLENLCGGQQTVFKAIKLFLINDLKKKTSKLLHH